MTGGDWAAFRSALEDAFHEAMRADPLLAALALAVLGGVLCLALIGLLRLGLGRRSAAPTPAPLAEVAESLAAIGAGQERLAGALGQGLGQAAEAAARERAETLRLLEARLDAVGARLGQGLETGATRSAEALGALTQRLEAVDRAQAAITRLSEDVLGLQDILGDKQARGAFGELQLEELIRAQLPPSAFRLQATLSGGRRADALLLLPNPPGPIAVDAKFPLEAYEALGRTPRGPERDRAAKLFAKSVRAHVVAVADRYIAPGETADGALMFVPSEAVYAEIHARCPEVVREGFARRVWIVSPTTLMATLTTLRAVLKDATLREEAATLRRDLAGLGTDLTRLLDQAGRLRRHFGQAEQDVAAVERAAHAALRRLSRYDAGVAPSAERQAEETLNQEPSESDAGDASPMRDSAA